MNNCYVFAAGCDFSPTLADNVMDSIFKQYERVIVESIATSFGLGFIVNDRHGGDVDTIHNVRKIDEDKQMDYKNKANKEAYNSQGEYKSPEYHKGTNYQTIKGEARQQYSESRKTVEDAYTGNDLHFLGKSKGANPQANAELDHVISANSIHKDRGRVLSNLDGKDLANSRENLQFTNKSLNASMQDMEIPDYIEKHPELPPEVKEKMIKRYKKAKSNYDSKVNKAYYSSPKFAKDVAFAAGNTGLKMGLQQALGFVFAEIWFAVKDELQNIKEEFDLAELFYTIGNGIKKGFVNAKEKYKEVFAKFLDGATAGVLSSLTTTLCNIFFTTAKNVVKIIRQTSASLVQAASILFINPDSLPFEEMMRAVIKIIATAASVVVGGMVSEAVGKTPVATIPVIGNIVQLFCGTFVTGIMSCTLLYYFDRSALINDLVNELNNIHPIDAGVNYYHQQADYFERYAAKLMEIDIEKLREETSMYYSLSIEIENAKSEKDLNNMLNNALNTIGVKIPWEGDIDSFMNNKNSVLIFE